jgi:hypothetical protein
MSVCLSRHPTNLPENASTVSNAAPEQPVPELFPPGHRHDHDLGKSFFGMYLRVQAREARIRRIESLDEYPR